MAENSNDLMDKLVALCKRRGFIFQSSEIYGGINGFWDYGPLGVELKRNVKEAWWQTVVRKRDDVVGLDAAIIMNPKVWQASGHVEGFTDPMVDCKKCKARYRQDEIQDGKCPQCSGELTDARQFNLMFKSHAGAMEDSASVVYLRPETAQGIFCNYKNVLDTSRLKLPFGIAQIGKAFRNEINPRNYTFRSREFEQMEVEFFCPPDEADKWYEYWRDARYQWYVDLGLTSEKLHLRNHEPDELAHYAVSCADIEYEFPFGVSELEGVANRTDYDLKAHQAASGRDMTYFDDETKERFIPYVIEPSGGVDRATLAFLCEAYCEDSAPDDKGKMKKRTVMKFHPRLAPIKVAVFPLVKKEGMPEIARKIYEACRDAGLACFYDEKGAVGRRYRRQDEAGTPFCVTIDGQTLQDQTVTVRDRDSLAQQRIAADKVVEYVRQRIG
ncbi:MAG: glycine--tRNA ligase [Planctomycetota bacterium]|nr:glycine--tRNA ligase [Planctomycetota bacterium]